MNDSPLLPLLRRVAMLEPLDDAALREFAALVRIEPVTARALVFREGEPAQALYIVVSGSIEIFKDGNGVPERVLATLGPGDFFGEMGIFESSPRQASARAATSGSLGKVGREALLRFVEARPAVDSKIRRTMVKRHTENISTAFRK